MAGPRSAVHLWDGSPRRSTSTGRHQRRCGRAQYAPVSPIGKGARCERRPCDRSGPAEGHRAGDRAALARHGHDVACLDIARPYDDAPDHAVATADDLDGVVAEIETF